MAKYEIRTCSSLAEISIIEADDFEVVGGRLEFTKDSKLVASFSEHFWLSCRKLDEPKEGAA